MDDQKTKQSISQILKKAHSGSADELNYKSLENDIREILAEKILDDYDFAQEMYAALCNTGWVRTGVPDALATFFSWRYAGGVIASIRNGTDSMSYMEFYCGGNEGIVSDLVREYMSGIGWEPISLDRADEERARIAAEFRSATAG
jgi:hypothetical protein